MVEEEEDAYSKNEAECAMTIAIERTRSMMSDGAFFDGKGDDYNFAPSATESCPPPSLTSPLKIA